MIYYFYLIELYIILYYLRVNFVSFASSVCAADVQGAKPNLLAVLDSTPPKYQHLIIRK